MKRGWVMGFLAVACGALYLLSFLIFGRATGFHGTFGEPEAYFVAATGIFFLLAGLWVLGPALSLFVQRKRALKDQPVRTVSRISPEIVSIRLKPREAKIGLPGDDFYDLVPDPSFSLPPVCTCCCSNEELTTVKESIAYRRFKVDLEGNPQFYHKHTRYLDFDIPYCGTCLLHVKLGHLAPHVALLVAALLFPAVDVLFAAMTDRKLLASSASDLVFYGIASVSLFLVGLLYIWFGRQTSRVPAHYHWAGAVIGGAFCGILYWPMGLMIPITFVLGKISPGALGLHKAAPNCAYWNWGKALTSMPSSPVGPDVRFECGNLEYTKLLKEQRR